MWKISFCIHYLPNFNDLIVLEEQSWDLDWDFINDRELVQFNVHSSTASWHLLIPTSERKNLDIILFNQ